MNVPHDLLFTRRLQQSRELEYDIFNSRRENGNIEIRDVQASKIPMETNLELFKEKDRDIYILTHLCV